MGLRGIDLFCGAGGSSQGAVAAGIKMVGAVDQWDIATKTYADNFQSAQRNIVTGSLDDTTGADLFPSIGRVDVLIASPECTHHSLARGNRPRCDASRRSGWYVVNFIEDLDPEFIVLENVSMMRHWEGYRELYETLEKRYGYQMRAQILDAADFGVPQSRKRLFIFGSKCQRPPEIRPTVRRHRPASNILDRMDKWPAGPLDNGRRAQATLDRVKHAVSEIGSGRDFLTVYYGSDKAGGYQTLDRPLRTLTTVDRFGLVQWTGRRPTLRMLQVPELKRAMGLPAKFSMRHGTRRDRVKLLGNGVCPQVMHAVIQATVANRAPKRRKPRTKGRTTRKRA